GPVDLQGRQCYHFRVDNISLAPTIAFRPDGGMNLPDGGVVFQPDGGFLLALLAALSGCKGNVGTLGLFSTLPPNTCTSADAALNNPKCQLTLGEWEQGYIALPQEQVWYGA